MILAIGTLGLINFTIKSIYEEQDYTSFVFTTMFIILIELEIIVCMIYLGIEHYVYITCVPVERQD